MKNKLAAVFAVMTGVIALGPAAFATGDPVTDQITATQSTVTTWIGALLAAVTALTVAGVAVRLVPRIIRLLSRKITG